MSLDNFNENPYKPMTNMSVGGPVQDGDLREVMRSIGGWQLFLAILGFIGAGLMFLVAGGQMLLTMGMMGNAPGGGANFPATVVASAFLVAIVILFYLLPSYFLLRASQKIRAYANTGAGSSREVFESQRSFWRYIGIAVAIILGIYAMILLFALLFGLAGAFGR